MTHLWRKWPRCGCMPVASPSTRPGPGSAPCRSSGRQDESSCRPRCRPPAWRRSPWAGLPVRDREPSTLDVFWDVNEKFVFGEVVRSSSCGRPGCSSPADGTVCGLPCWRPQGTRRWEPFPSTTPARRCAARAAPPGRHQEGRELKVHCVKILPKSVWPSCSCA